MKTMTMWGAFAKLEAIAAGAERFSLPGRIEIREDIERLLGRSWTKKTLSEAVVELRGTLGRFQPNTAAYYDTALFNLFDYLDGKEVQLSGHALLEQLLEGVPTAC